MARLGIPGAVFDRRAGVVAFVEATDGRRGNAFATARAKALDLTGELATRMEGMDGDDGGLGSRARDGFEVIMMTFRKETSMSVRSGALKTLLTLARRYAGEIGRGTMQAYGRALRRDFESYTKNSKTVKGLILRVIGGMREGLRREGLTLVTAEEAMEDSSAPTAKWLMTASCRILDAALDDEEDVKKEIVLMASALYAITASLSARVAEEGADKANFARIVRIVEHAVSLRETGTRTDMSKAALDLITTHAHALRHELVKISSKMFELLLNLRTHNNKELARCAAAAYEEFLPAMRDAFVCDTFSSSRDSRAKLLDDILKVIMRMLDDEKTSQRDKTACVHALGKFAAPAMELLSDDYAEVNTYMERLGKLTMYIKFQQGENEFQERFESIERQVALLSAFSDVLRSSNVMIDEALLETFAGLVVWIWEQYAFELERRKPQIRNALLNLFVVLASKGCALQTLLTRIGSQLLFLTLRFSEPDPIDKVLCKNDPVPMWPRYVDLWTALIGGGNECAAGVYGCFVNELLNFCTTLDLGIVTPTGEDSNSERNARTDTSTSDDLDTTSVAVSLGDDASASNPGDMCTFLQLVEFAQRVIEESPADALLPWVNHISTKLMAMANRNSSISAFYKLIGTIVNAADRSGYFGRRDSAEVEQVVALFREFLRDVLQDTRRFSGELLASVLQLLLTLPSVILPIENLIAPLLRALELGLQHPPVTTIALNTLERWLDGKHLDETSPHLVQIAKRLSAYLDSASSSNAFFGEVYESEGRDRKKKQASEEQDEMRLKRATFIRIVKILGSMGGAAHGLLSAKSNSELDSPWDSDSKLSMPIGLVRSSTKLWLDKLLPRTSHLAMFSQDRATKIAACEALYGSTVFLIGRSAQGPTASAGDFTRSASQYRSIFEKLFPIIFELSVDADAISRKLFSDLSFQMTRWYAKSQARELDVTLCLFDALIEGLSNTSKAGAVRDLCASLVAELLEWSIKYVRDTKAFEGTVNHRYILRTLFGLMGHTGSAHRLGAVTALRKCLKHVTKHRNLLDEYVLEILNVTFKSIERSGEHSLTVGVSTRGADVAMAIVVREILRAIQTHAKWLLHSPGSTVSKCTDSFMRSLLELTASGDDFLRREAQQAFATIAPLALSDVRRWLQGNLHVISSCVDASVPEMKALENGSKRLLNRFIAVVQWSSWTMSMHFTDLEFFTASRTTHFHAVGQYLDSISGRLESSFVLEQDTPANQTGHLAREILVLFDSILNSPWSGGDKEALLALSLPQENGNRRVIKLISSSIFYSQNIANDADSSRKYLMPAAAQLLRTLTKDHGSSKVARLGEEAFACLRGLIALPKFDLGAINLENAQGCIAAQRLADGYRELANVLVLRRILPQEGESSAKNLTRRAATVVRNLFHANPPQRVVGQVVMQLCLHLNIAPSALLDLLLDRVQDSDAKLGETFYRNYREPILRACKYSFDDYAGDLFKVAGADVQSPSGAVVTDVIVSVIELSIPKENATQTRSLDGGRVLATLKKNMSHLCHLYEDHEDASAVVKNTCHQRFLAILRAAVKLNRALGSSHDSIASEDSYTSFLTVMAGLMRCVRCDCISLSSQVDAVMITAEILEGINISKSSRDALEKSLSDSLKNMVVQERCDSTTFKKRFPSTVKAFKQAFSKYQAPSLIAALLPFYDDSDSKSVLLEEDVTEIRWNAAVAQQIWLIAEDEHVAVESRALAVCRILPKLLSSSDPTQVLAFFTDNAKAIAQDIGGGKTDILSRLRTFGVLSAMYSKCTKQEVMDGPCVQVPKLNALVSKAVISELSGHGTASKSLLGQESIALHATKMAFSVFASLLTCTQTDVKFYAKLFENVASWNNLVDRTKRVKLEATMEVKRAQRNLKADVSTTRLKSFTLSSNLAAMYSLKPSDTAENDNLAADEDIAQQDNHSKGTPRDELEAHPVSDGVFKMLKLVVMRGLTGDASGLRPEMQLLEMVSCLLYSPAVLASVKLLVVKALLRLNDDLTSESSGDVGMTVLITQPSFLAAHSDLMIALLSAMIEITKESDAAYVSTPLRKTINIALECDNLWSSNFEEAKTSIFEATELVIKSGYSRNEDIFRENLKLCSKLFSRLRDTARMTSTPTSHCFQSSMYQLQRHLECKPKDPRNTSLVKVCALRKKFAIKLIEILINAEAPVLCVRDTSVFITTAQGKKIDEEIPSPLLNILLRFIDKDVRKGLTTLAASLLGRIMKIDGGVAQWHKSLQKQLKGVSDDLLLNTLDQITISCPSFVHDAGFAPSIQSRLDTFWGEPRCVALLILTRDHRPERVQWTYDRLLPFVGSLLKQRDCEVMIILFEALTRGAQAITRTQRDANHIELWKNALVEADNAVSMESAVKVRESHTNLCIAIAETYPKLINESSLQGPLLRALADPVSLTCRQTALQFWNKRLQFDNLVTRLHDTLQLIPHAKVESLWLAAACRLLFAVQEMNPASRAPLIDNDLSECVFTSVKLDSLRRRGASQTMAPLFSTQAQDPDADEKRSVVLSTILANFKQPARGDPTIATSLPYELANLLQSQEHVKDFGAFHEIAQNLDIGANKKKIDDFLVEELKNSVKLTRSYRTGDLPDVKISCHELITPFLLCAERDSAVACTLLRELANSAQHEFAFILKDQNDARPAKEAMAIVAQPLKDFVGSIEGRDASLVRFILSLCEVIPQAAEIPVDHVVRLATRGRSLSSGVIAMESMITSGDQSPQTWEALAKLYRSLGYDDAALLSFVNAFPHQEETMCAIRQEMAGNVRDAVQAYKHLLSAEIDRSPRESEFLKHEFFRCAERLGEWDEIGKHLEDVRTGEFKIEDLSCIPGEASGGSSICTAFRVALRQPLEDWSPFLTKVLLQEDSTRKLKHLGVEIAMNALLSDSAGDDTREVHDVLQQVYQSFIDSWSTTCSASVAIRRKLLQALQPAVEIDETLRTIDELKTGLRKLKNMDIKKAESIVNQLESKWQTRWPSAAYDASEVWERVVTFRSRMLGTLASVIPEIRTDSIATMRTEMFLRASDGLRQVGQVVLSRKFLRQYIESVVQTGAPEDLRLHEAVFKLKLSMGTNTAMEQSLEMCRKLQSEDRWREDDKMSLTILEAQFCEHLASARDDDSLSHSIAAINSYISVAERSTNAAQASEASLRLAHFCDTALKKLHGEYVQTSVSTECAEALNGWLVSSLNDASSLAEVFILHTLKALAASSAHKSTPARHLLPRLLTLLRETCPDARDYSQTLLRVPTWLFLDWIPQLLSMVSDVNLRKVAAPLVQRLVSKYPAAVRPHFNLIKETMDKHISERMNFSLASSLHDGFNRGMELLDFPSNRLNFWRQQIQLREYQHDVNAASNIVDGMISDLTNTEDPLLGLINKRFVEIASPMLTSAIATARREKTSVNAALKHAEAQIVAVWVKEFPGLNNASRIRLSDFSSWFASYASFAGVSTALEIPGQYDNINAPPDMERHVTIMGFAPEVQVFESKQRPKKITMRGSDGRDYQFIVKGGEDLRQDERIQRLFRAMNGLLASNTESRGRGLEVRTFHVSPLSNRTGLIEFLRKTSPLLRLLSKPVEEANVTAFVEHQRWIKERATGLGKRKRESAHVDATTHSDYLSAIGKASKDDSVAILTRLKSATTSPDALRKILFTAAGSAEAFVMMRQSFATSLASSSICGYVAGVGDRHLDNILLDISTGELVHIDFGYAFGTATHALPIPELVPFRATPALLDVFSPLNARTWLETDMCRTMKALQDGSTLLKGVMDIFLRDPLIDWERESVSAGTQSHIQNRITRAWGKLELDNPAVVVVDECESKHKNSAHWTDLRKTLVGANAPPAKKCTDVEHQIRALLDLATNPELLAVAWSGWRPWL